MSVVLFAFLALFSAAAHAATATISVNGTLLTIMPCSYTTTLDDKLYSVCVNAQIGYLDAQGEYRIFNYRDCRAIDQEAMTGAGFGFNFVVDIPDAVEIIAINSVSSVEIFTQYGIHGYFTFVYSGESAATGSAINIQTSRVGQCNTVPGMTSGYGLIPPWENGGVVPGTPLPMPAAPVPVVAIAPPAAPSGHCSCNVTCTGNFWSTWVDMYGITPGQCTHDDPAMRAAEGSTCPNWGVGSKGACNWVE